MKQESKQDLGTQPERSHHRDGDEDSMSPEMRQLAISWGGMLEHAPDPRMEERELEASRRN